MEDTISLRIQQLVNKFADGKTSKFASLIGVSEANIRGYVAGIMPKYNTLRDISLKLPVNSDWLLTGKGPMLRPEAQRENREQEPLGILSVAENNSGYGVTRIYEPVVRPSMPKEAGIPLLPISAMAGALSGDVSVLEYECERYIVPAFQGADFLIQVKGSSMYPKYSSGDIVACKRVAAGDLFFQWNKVYVLDTDQGPLIKRVKRGTSDDSVLIVSDNAAYDPFELRRDQIRGVALVIGVIRLE